jgi:hypothetical protein
MVSFIDDHREDCGVEPIIGLIKTEVIHRLGPWRGLDQVEFETLDWVDWFNNVRFSSQSETSHLWSSRSYTIRVRKFRPWWPDSHNGGSGIPGAVQ